jgi:hypothetical protein
MNSTHAVEAAGLDAEDSDYQTGDHTAATTGDLRNYISDAHAANSQRRIDASFSGPLKSCLSSRKPARKDVEATSYSVLAPRSAKKSVAFSSPEAAEFDLNEPATEITPMNKRRAKEEFPLDKPEVSLPFVSARC